MLVEACVQVKDPAAATGTSGATNSARLEAATTEDRRTGNEGILMMFGCQPYGFHCEC